MELTIHHIDAFTNEVFGGNPAAVITLDAWLDDDVLQAIAAENNLSETSFVLEDAAAKTFHIRWFTPTVEVDLCGHATLAAAFVLFDGGKIEGDRIEFTSRSGSLCVDREGDHLVLDFPSDPPRPVDLDDSWSQALGLAPRALLEARYHLAVFDRADDVIGLRPDFAKVAELPAYGVIATAPGEADECDFVSRFFGPKVGVLEDPVCGSAHCALTPYWSQRLGKTKLRARQVSARGGWLNCEDLGERVRIAGQAVRYLEGRIRF